MNWARTHKGGPGSRPLKADNIAGVADCWKVKVRDRWNQREEGYRYAKWYFLQKLWVLLQSASSQVKIEVIGKDGIGFVITDENHQNALDEVQKAHYPVKPPQAGKFLFVWDGWGPYCL